MENDVTLRTTIQSFIDDECLGIEGTISAAPLPHPSVAELRELANVCKPELRVVKIHDDTRLVGMALCCLTGISIHGVRARAYKLFGGHVHDYTRLYASDRYAFAHLLEQIRLDAQVCGADVADLGNLLIPHDADLIPSAYLSSFPVCIFDAARSGTGWRQTMEKKNGQREWKRAARLPGFHAETTVGTISRTQVEALARLHRERWHFDGQPSAFDNPRRVEEYLCHPANKILTSVSGNGEILACHYGMVYGDLLIFHTPVVNVKYLDISPLKLVLYATAQYCHDAGLRYLDFGLGSEEYKESYANTSRIIHNVLFPVSGKGKLVQLLRLHGRPAAIKALLGRIRERAARIKKSVGKRISPTRWYEAEGAAFEGSHHQLSCFDTYGTFVDFSRKHGMPVYRQHYRRYKENAFFLVLHDGNNILAHAWGTR
ncbi:MAG: GNAT family N-acetyltransferase, partial [Verrucomicrobia bacterium]|nr:GNAT family N-acetyltransferase [Verrucomicrobiota bacterium]